MRNFEVSGDAKLDLQRSWCMQIQPSKGQIFAWNKHVIELVGFQVLAQMSPSSVGGLCNEICWAGAKPFGIEEIVQSQFADLTRSTPTAPKPCA
jgi:hypothetical protein